MDLEGVVVPDSVPRPKKQERQGMAERLQEMIDRPNVRQRPKGPEPGPSKRPRVLPFSTPSHLHLSSRAKSSHSHDLKQIADMRRWAERVARHRKGEDSNEEEEQQEEDLEKGEKEETKRHAQSTAELMIELDRQHSQRMKEQAEANSARLAVGFT